MLNTGSVAGTIAWGGSVYGATKGAVHQLTRAVAIEGAPFGIRANAICPAAMPFTGFLAAGGTVVPDDQLEGLATAVGQQHPLGRPILAEDCAEAGSRLPCARTARRTSPASCSPSTAATSPADAPCLLSRASAPRRRRPPTAR